MELKNNISWWWLVVQCVAIVFKIYGWVDFSWWIIFIPSYCIIVTFIICAIYVVWYINHL